VVGAGGIAVAAGGAAVGTTVVGPTVVVAGPALASATGPAVVELPPTATLAAVGAGRWTSRKPTAPTMATATRAIPETMDLRLVTRLPWSWLAISNNSSCSVGA
jgi:hypothetical protein